MSAHTSNSPKPVTTHPNSEPAAPIDFDHLNRYTLGDKALEREILGLFSQTLAVSIETMTAPSTHKEWAAATHTLKGSARAIGATWLAELAQKAEVTNDTAKAPSARRDILAKIISAADLVYDVIKSRA